MAHYILVTETDDGSEVTHVEAKNRTEAARRFFNDPNAPEAEAATLYRVAAEPVTVRMRTETVTKVEVE